MSETMEQREQSELRAVMPEMPFQVREAINALRGNILMSGYKIQTIAVTSALMHEGKSNTAFRLAKSLAALEKKVIYVDCDIRNSEMLKRFRIRGEMPGLSEFLCGQISLKPAICQTDDPYFDMIFAGSYAPNPSELISGKIFSQMLEWLKRSYDYVILDTAPVNAVIDGVIVAKQCDGTILVVENGVTDRKQLIKAKTQLDYTGVKVLGVVLNKVKVKKGHYGKYGYGYGYGYGEENEKK